MGNIEERAWRIRDALLMMKWLNIHEMQAILGKDLSDTGEVILWLAARRMIDCRLEGDQLIVKLGEEERTAEKAPAWPMQSFGQGLGQS